MDHILHKAKCLAFTLTLAAGMTGLAFAQSDASNSGMGMNSQSTVQHAQRELKQKGFYSGRIDGIDGPKTRMAVRNFQRANGLDQSGRLNRATLGSLGLSNMRGNHMGEASRSADEAQTQGQYNNQGQYNQGNSSGNLSPDVIRSTQQRLANDGFYSGKVDGVMNEGTRNALSQYQKANNLPQTGRLTRETAHKMGVSTSNGRFENSSPLEQLGKGIAEGAKGNNNNNNTNRNDNNSNRR